MCFFVFLHYITRRVPVQRAVERDEIPYPYKVHDTALRPLLNITIKSTKGSGVRKKFPRRVPTESLSSLVG